METATSSSPVLPLPVLMVAGDEHDAIARTVAHAVAGTIAAQVFHGSRLRAIRHSLGLPQTQLSAMLGVSQPALSNVETGSRLLNPHAALKLARLVTLHCDDVEHRDALESISSAAIVHAIAATATPTPTPTATPTQGGNAYAASGIATCNAAT